MASPNKLPPIDFKDEEKYDPVSESTTIDLKRCSHKSAKIVNGELRCKCGAAWRGFRLSELQELFQNR
ncbi:hypothetical protein KO465_09040 [Candidatus Micrarchaeota archaeon]|nr:hypothetical protein [Candidatus Micrarchaeota archaeon]